MNESTRLRTSQPLGKSRQRAHSSHSAAIFVRDNSSENWITKYKYRPAKDVNDHADAIVAGIITALSSTDGESAARSGHGILQAGDWLYRGHEDATWRIVATTRRSMSAAQLKLKSSRRPLSPMLPFDAMELRIAERLARRRFGVTNSIIADILSKLQQADSDNTRRYRAWHKLHTTGTIEEARARWEGRAPLLHELRCAAEYQAVRDFAQIADDAGLRIHDDLSSLPSADDALDTGESEWLPSETTALAQHHGIKTKLLDWTRRIRVALYFAMQPKTDNGGRVVSGLKADQDGNCAIWALNARALLRAGSPDRRDRPYVRVLQCRQEGNRFLHAQDGLFTWFDEDCQRRFYTRKGYYPSLDDVLVDEGLNQPGTLRKFIIPRKFALAVRSQLRSDRISRATVMPTYDHVSKSVEWLWFDRGHSDPMIT